MVWERMKARNVDGCRPGAPFAISSIVHATEDAMYDPRREGKGSKILLLLPSSRTRLPFLFPPIFLTKALPLAPLLLFDVR